MSIAQNRNTEEQEENSSSRKNQMKLLRACINDPTVIEAMRAFGYDESLSEEEIVEIGLRYLLIEEGYLRQ